MNNRNRSFTHRRTPKILSVVLIISLFALILGSFSPVTAQLGNEAWTQPVNLSNSGGASNPVMVIDSDGVFHVIWQDAFSGFVYTQGVVNGDTVQWSQPATVEFPWGKSVPQLYADSKGYIHAFWISKDDSLHYSRVYAKTFATAWETVQKLDDAVLALDAAQDTNGMMHLAYLHSKDTTGVPAGIYYRQEDPGSNDWAAPIQLYQSPYLRSITAEDANLQVDASGNGQVEHIYVVWDNPSRQRVSLIKSDDAGKTWAQPTDIDAPESDAAAAPSGIQISATGDNVFLLWQAKLSGSTCTQYYKTSVDAGNTWGDRQQKPQDLLDCPKSNELLKLKDTSLLQFSIIKDQVYLQAWDGTKWSDPQAQDILTSFLDPGTNQPVNFSCQQPEVLGGENLYVIGCDKGSGQDIWWMKRQLIDIADWFPKEVVWQPVTNIAKSKVSYLTPALISASDGKLHAFWSQPDSNFPDGPGASIYYARWDGQQWSQPVSILASPVGKAEEPSAALDPSGRLYVVWSGGDSGRIYFSQADSSQAMIVTNWSKPVALPSPKPVGSSPEIHVGKNGTIYVVYAVPLNEDRGIYITSSTDQGITWSQPVQIFNAASAGWQMVDKPHLTETDNGTLHIVWTQNSLPSGVGPLGLYYSRSADGGKVWSQPATVIDQPVGWSMITSIGEQTVHRLWQEMSSGRTTLWHEVSQDNGTTWNRTSPASIFGDTVGSPSISMDNAGQLHLLQMVSRGASSYILQYWLWNGSAWITEKGLDLNLPGANSFGEMVGDASAQGMLYVLFSATVNSQAGIGLSQQDNLYFANRSYNMPAGIATQSALEGTPVPASAATMTSAPQQTSIPATEGIQTSSATFEPQNTGPVTTGGNALVGSVLIPVGAGLIVLVAILIAVRMRRP
jgi:hypothetical protein